MVPAARFALIVLLATAAPAQEPTGLGDPPHRFAVLVPGTGQTAFRPSSASADARALFEQGLALWHAGDSFEAERSFRHAAWLDPGCAIAHWGMAISADHPNRAAECAWQAFARRAEANVREQRLIEAWARCLGAEHSPKLPVAAPDDAARERLRVELAALCADAPDDVELRALSVRESVAVDPDGARDALAKILASAPAHPVQRHWLRAGVSSAEEAWRCGRSAPAVAAMWRAAATTLTRHERHDDAARAHEAAARADHAWMRRHRRMPHEVPGHAASVAEWCASLVSAGRLDEARDVLDRLVALPRHPRDGDPTARHRALRQAIAEATAAAAPRDDRSGELDGIGPERWRPAPAAAFRLPRADGPDLTLAGLRGKPFLLVFFLGFGCVHCVDQLDSLAPRAAEFEAAGIPIVTVGTDTLDQVRASHQRALEADEPPFPFPVASDPELVAFRQWGCFDEFEATALHGTFLIDGDGLVRWQDISVEPFMATEFLLRECRRLLAQPEPRR
jgi:peroxiredoxin